MNRLEVLSINFKPFKHHLYFDGLWFRKENMKFNGLKTYWKKLKSYGISCKYETIIWTTCIFGLTALTIHQLLPLFAQFLTDPPDTSIEIYQNTTLSLPPAAVCLPFGRPPTFTKTSGIFQSPRYSESPMNFWAPLTVDDAELDEKCREFMGGLSINKLCEVNRLHLKSYLDSECINVTVTLGLDALQQYNAATSMTREQNCSYVSFMYHRSDTLCEQPVHIYCRNSKMNSTQKI